MSRSAEARHVTSEGVVLLVSDFPTHLISGRVTRDEANLIEILESRRFATGGRRGDPERIPPQLFRCPKDVHYSGSKYRSSFLIQSLSVYDEQNGKRRRRTCVFSVCRVHVEILARIRLRGDGSQIIECICLQGL